MFPLILKQVLKSRLNLGIPFLSCTCPFPLRVTVAPSETESRLGIENTFGEAYNQPLERADRRAINASIKRRQHICRTTEE